MTHTNTYNKQPITRFYNSLLINGNRVIKGAPKDRFLKETEWFKEAEKRIPDHIPHIFNFNKCMDCSDNNSGLNYYEMQAIDGKNLYQWAIINKKKAPEVFDKLIRLSKDLHAESYKVKTEDIYQMYYIKPKIALTNFIDQSKIGVDTLIINNKKVINPVKQLEDTYKRLEKRLRNTRYSFIHGDLTMSNTLVNRKKDLFLIDPRGAFGSTNIYGDVRYDVAKLYYSIVGNFDSLNNGHFHYKKGLAGLNAHYYSIADSGFSDYGKKILNMFGEEEEIVHYIHATIWLSLIPHVSNNSRQQFCTFCHGINLLNNVNKHEK